MTAEIFKSLEGKSSNIKYLDQVQDQRDLKLFLDGGLLLASI